MTSTRDHAIVAAVGQFKQMTSAQVSKAFFDNASKTPVDRTLQRLLTSGHLARTERRLVGGDGGGSGQYVYQLGRQGWKDLKKSGHYWRHRTVRPHMLAVADCYVQLVQAERVGLLKLHCFQVEPRPTIEGAEDITLEPDAEVRLELADGRKVAYWLEVDLGTERHDILEAKCKRYSRAFMRSEAEHIPYSLWAVPDEDRVRDVQKALAGCPADALPVFRLAYLSTLSTNIVELGA